MTDTKVKQNEKDEIIERIFKHAPQTDTLAWKLYPKYNWVYETTRILNFQKITWKPFRDSDVTASMYPFSLDIRYNLPNLFELTHDDNKNIFISEQYISNNDYQLTTMIIHKGQPVYQVHYDNNYKTIDHIPGELELKILGLLSWYFEKYCGLVTFVYNEKMFFQVSLAVDRNILENVIDESVLKKLTALYSRRQWRS